MSQSVSTLMRLRELVIGGELLPGHRVSELAIVDRLGVSRTPVRAALARLEQEGLLETIPSGGFMVKSFTEAEIRDAIEIRGTLEGMAARFAAERRKSDRPLARIRETLDQIDAVLSQSLSDVDVLTAYEPLNATFHDQIVSLADSPVLAREITRVCAIPFASPNAFMSIRGSLAENRSILVIAHDQHRCLFDAIIAREGTRAQAIMQEHSRLAARHLELALPHAFDALRGITLLRPSRSLRGPSCASTIDG